MFQIKDMFENGKPNIVLKEIYFKKNSYYNFDFNKKFKIENCCPRHV